MRHRAGFYYHIYNRGCNRERIFETDENYLFLLRRIQEYRATYPITFIAYCLMPNHYHFLLRPEENDVLSPFIQRLFNSYTQAFNRQQGRSGTLFEGRVRTLLVDCDVYLLHLCRYIHMNPVEARLVTDPSEWAYSNYLEWMNLRTGTLVDRRFVKERFESPEIYRRFVTMEVPYEIGKEIQRYYLE